MPNWCHNTLTIDYNHLTHVSLNRTMLEGIKEFVRDGDNPFSFERFLPTPHELRGEAPTRKDDEEQQRLLHEYGAVDWYEWQCRNWGTKWGPVNAVLEREDDVGGPCLEYAFDTAWAPPVEGIKALSEHFPQATFTLAWDEPGMDFGGFMIMRAGQILMEEDGGSRMTTWADLAEMARSTAELPLAEATLPNSKE